MLNKMRLAPSKSSSSGPRGELALLSGIRDRARATTSLNLRLGIGDDCALLHIRANEELAVTTDLSIAGRHFRLDWHSPEAIGHRILARGLSDLAAMGARPVAAFLSLGLPQEFAGKWLTRFFDGFFALAQQYRTPLAGGDLAESPTVAADIVLTGTVRHGKALLRSGAKPGDLIYVTGKLGGAAAGLAGLGKLAGKQRGNGAKTSTRRTPHIPVGLRGLLAPHLRPQPRIAQGLWLARRSVATAAIDLSDGLSTDLAHLCEDSGVAAEVIAAALPIHTAATQHQALHGGEDYELLFTASHLTRVPRSIAGIPVTRIGKVAPKRAAKPQVALVNGGGSQPLEPRGWEHFV
jgi:thiamine-monophosphate kinase